MTEKDGMITALSAAAMVGILMSGRQIGDSQNIARESVKLAKNMVEELAKAGVKP